MADIPHGRAADGEIEIVGENPVYENSFGTLYDDAVLFPSGAAGRYLRFNWKSAGSVAVLPVMEDGSIAMIRVFRHAVRRWVLEIPKGFCPLELTPEEAALRELREEMGIECRSLERLRQVWTDPGFIDKPTILFVARGCRIAHATTIEAQEAIAPPEFHPLEALRNGQLEDAISLIALLSVNPLAG